MHKETVTPELFKILQKLMTLEQLAPLRLVGGTAISLQMGHRKSLDIDLFCNEKLSKQTLIASLQKNFENTQPFTTSYSVNTTINDIKVDIYDDWSIPFKKPVLNQEGVRLANLEDLVAFKLTAITERREKKDYVDLFFLFNKFGAAKMLDQYKIYNPLLSSKSILFALREIVTAEANKSVMPDMLLPFNWKQAIVSFESISKEYFRTLQKPQNNKFGMSF
ncbi:MAG: nucleotidyl transferase AbiEii/AbiGii toxin family protein [Cyclobacteriaceae bacterium]